MDPSSSNGFQLENKPTWELGTNPNPNSTSNNSDAILRCIDQFLMEDELEQHIMLQESYAFRAKERSFYEALGEKYPPSPQQESSSLNVAQHVDDANNTDEVIIEKISDSEAMDKNVPIQEFDDSVWMYTADEKLADDIANMQITGNNMMQPRGAKVRSKKRNNREKFEVVDLEALLIDCSKSVSSGDHFTTNNLLTRIRQHSSPFGNGTQRLAHYFANGLEARLAGTGSKLHGITETSDYWRVCRLFNASSPMRKISSFALNETITVRSKKATRIHIIDFGILYGIPWPSIIQCVAGREGGPPEKLRITGIEFPQVAEIIEDTGRRLARYAETLGVPFEYKAIAQEWETINIEDLKIEKDEFVAVFCSIRSMKLLNEMVGVAESPRDVFLKLVRKINPDIFIHGIINGAFSQPHFVYRFRELMLHYFTVFDMLETFVPGDTPERIMIERDFVGRDILNVIACEGAERVERPETCRQWQVRHVKAGFVKVPFERRLIDAISSKVGSLYHKEFSISEENQWMVTSWKGRTIYAITCWQPAAA